MGIFSRLFAVQGSWSYERLTGTGIGFCVEPALRHLPGGRGGVAYRAALARESRYFNTHPYLAGIAVGALVRAELDGCDPARIDRFRTALCSPLGSLGDRLVWAGWLPMASLAALLAFALGAGPLLVLALFLIVYNTVHLGLRAWGLRMGWRHGLGVATVLKSPVLRTAPRWVSGGVALLAGVVLPLLVRRLSAESQPRLAVVLVAAGVAALSASRLSGRIEGWRVAIVLFLLLALYSAVPQ